LIVIIHTDSDFSIEVNGLKVTQVLEKAFIRVASEEEFISKVLDGSIKSSNGGNEILRNMAECGRGEYGNYSYSILNIDNFISDVDKKPKFK